MIRVYSILYKHLLDWIISTWFFKLGVDYYHNQFGYIPNEYDFNNIIYAIQHNKIIYSITNDRYILNIIEKTDNSDSDKPNLPILSFDFITGVSL